jgi:hypothetical protein
LITPVIYYANSALVGAVDRDGKPIFSGKAVTGFSNAEEEAVGMTKVMLSDCWVTVIYSTV